MRRLTLAAICVLLLAACGPSGVRIAIDNAVLLDPEAALAAADEAFTDWLGETPASHDDPRCYFEALPHDGRPEDHPVEPRAWCGPVLSLDHDERYPWALVEFATVPDAGGRLAVSVTGGFQPAGATPSRLLLADGTAAPDGNTDLDYPEPPPLEAGHSERLASPYRIGTEAQEATSTVFALHDGHEDVTEVALRVGLAESIGEARTRRVAPDGHQLLLLDVQYRGSFPIGSVIAHLESDGEEFPLDVEHPFDEGQTLAVVPEDASLGFTVFQAGVEQRLNLRSGDVERDPRAQRALDVGVRHQQLALEIDASWTETTSYEDYFGNVYTYDGMTYNLDGRCESATVSPFHQGWAPEGTAVVEVICSEVAADLWAELTTRAMELSGRLQVDGATLEPVDVSVAESRSWQGDVSVRYRFEAPVTAASATFVFQGHAYIDDEGMQAFSPSASARIDLDGGED